MSKYPAPTRRDHKRFCEIEGWEPKLDGRGNTGDHYRYELALPNGDILYTQVSHPPNRDGYGVGMWQSILKEQLRVTEAEFWACVKDRALPERGAPVVPESAIPANLVALLIQYRIAAEAEIATMTKDEAIAKLNEYWTHGG